METLVAHSITGKTWINSWCNVSLKSPTKPHKLVLPMHTKNEAKSELTCAHTVCPWSVMMAHTHICLCICMAPHCCNSWEGV